MLDNPLFSNPMLGRDKQLPQTTLDYCKPFLIEEDEYPNWGETMLLLGVPKEKKTIFESR